MLKVLVRKFITFLHTYTTVLFSRSLCQFVLTGFLLLSSCLTVPFLRFLFFLQAPLRPERVNVLSGDATV